MYERMHSEGEEIPVEEYPIAALEREIIEAEHRILELRRKCERAQSQIASYESNERRELSKIEILTEAVERLKEEL